MLLITVQKGCLHQDDTKIVSNVYLKGNPYS